MLKKVLIAIAVVLLIAVPLVGRGLYYYEEWPRARQVPRPDLGSIQSKLPDMPAFADQPAASGTAPGVVVVDRAHDNRFDMSELNVLQARLAARGQRLETADTSEDLLARLRSARALVLISPGTSLSAAEIQAIMTFLDKGGRLLLVGDPTRYGILLDDYGDYAGLDSDATHLNDLAAQFGLVFQPDYLYNTVDNEGNFRNIRLTNLSSHALTAGLKTVVFYAAHSLITTDPALISADGDTRSSSSERADLLPVAVVAADGAVLALGDLTFMTEPYNTTYDNDRLVSNIADMLSGAQRRYELADFPFFFRDAVDLVYAGDPLLDTDLLKGGNTLQDLFTAQDRRLAVADAEDAARDTLFFGLYREADEVQPYLAAAGVTLVISSTETAADTAGEKPGPTPMPTTAPAVTPTAAITPTAVVTTTPGLTITPAVTATAEISPTAGGRADVEAVGRVVLSGTAMLLLQTDGDRQVLVVLASTETGLDSVVQRLGEGNLTNCIMRETEAPTLTVLALCPTGEVAAGDGPGGWGQKKTGPAAEPAERGPEATPPLTGTQVPTLPLPTTPLETPKQGNIMIVALDDTKGRYDGLSDAETYAAILKADYNVTVWSETKDGVPEMEDLLTFDLVIWAAGDFEEPFGEEDSQVLLMVMMAEVPAIISGGFTNQDVDNAVQRDLKITGGDHPAIKGFAKDQVIAFVPSPSGTEYAINVMDDSASEGGDVLAVRGPDSESSGAPSIIAMAEEGMRFMYIAFPLYLLPDDAASTLVLDSVGWMLSD